MKRRRTSLADLEEGRRDDVAHWGLTPQQAAYHYGRASGYYARRARHYADLSIRYARQGERIAWVGIVAGAIGAVMAIAAMLF